MGGGLGCRVLLNQLWLSGLGSRLSNFRRLRGRGRMGSTSCMPISCAVGMVTRAKTVSIVSQLQVAIASYMCMYTYIIHTYTLYICLSVTLLMTLETPLLNKHEP